MHVKTYLLLKHFWLYLNYFISIYSILRYLYLIKFEFIYSILYSCVQCSCSPHVFILFIFLIFLFYWFFIKFNITLQFAVMHEGLTILQMVNIQTQKMYMTDNTFVFQQKLTWISTGCLLECFKMGYQWSNIC